MGVSGGISWSDALNPLADIHPLYVWVFLLYFVFLYFAILNVIAAVFTENIMLAAQSDPDTVVKQRVASQEAYVRKLESLFHLIDVDESKTVALEEITKFLDAKEGGAHFDFIELAVTDASTLMNLINTSDTENITLQEFITGCVALRGPASQLNLAHVSYLVMSELALLKQAVVNMGEAVRRPSYEM